MKIAVVGAGAVGGYFGGRMVEHGLDVTFLLRPASAARLRERGLRITSALGDLSISKPPVSDDADALGPVEVAFIAVKASQVRAASEFVHPAVGASTTVIPMQNGVDAPRVLQDVLGVEPVLGGLCRIFSERISPGRIVHSGLRPSIAYGELGGGSSERVARVQDQLEPVEGMVSQVSDDIVTEMWKKLLTVAALGAVGAVSRAPLGAIRAVPETRALLQSVANEICAVARASGADLPEDFAEKQIPNYDKLTPETTASMHRDLARGVPSELDEQINAVRRYAHEAGIATPVIDVVYAALLPGELRANGRLAYEDVS